MLKNHLKFERRSDLELSGLECVWIQLNSKGQNVLLCSMYRQLNVNNMYYEKILDVLDKAFSEDCITILVGNLNINYLLDESLSQNPLHYIESL